METTLEQIIAEGRLSPEDVLEIRRRIIVYGEALFVVTQEGVNFVDGTAEIRHATAEAYEFDVPPEPSRESMRELALEFEYFRSLSDGPPLLPRRRTRQTPPPRWLSSKDKQRWKDGGGTNNRNRGNSRRRG